MKNPVPISSNGMIIRKPKPMIATAVWVSCRLLSVAVFAGMSINRSSWMSHDTILRPISRLPTLPLS